MTYKKIVKSMVQQNAVNWFEKLMSENGFECFVFVNDVEFENDKEKDTIFWTVKVDVYFKSDVGVRKYYEIGGTVDDLCGICCSVIWDNNHEIIWMSVKESREALGIKELKIA